MEENINGLKQPQVQLDKDQELNNIIEKEVQDPDKQTLDKLNKKINAWTHHQKQFSPCNKKKSEELKMDQAQNELDSLISAFTSPIPDNILTLYEKKKNKKTESALERTELKGVVYREFTIHIFQSINVLQNLSQIQEEEWKSRLKFLPFTKPGITKTIIFDLDETLAHCVRQQNPSRDPDIHLNITLPSGRILNAPFNIRPYTKEMLEQVNEHFEVVCFTASNSYYADVILDYIDPEKKYIQHRLYRDSCIKASNGDSEIYIKDLRIFGNRDLKDLIIVDNAVYSFGAQLSNGIPITPFKEDPEDIEFMFLMNYLQKLKDVEDFREANREVFKMELVYKFNNSTYIEEYENCEDCDDSADESDHEEEKDNKEKKLSKFVEAALDGFSISIAKSQSNKSKFTSSKHLLKNISV